MLYNSSELLQQRIYSSLNDSSTKQAYSFGHAIRFRNNEKRDNFYHFYDLPDIKSTRGTTLGYGKKCDYSKITGCGSNKLYAAPSYFDPKQHGYTFGVSRPNKIRRDISPGPIYDVARKFGGGPGYVFGTSGMKKNRKLLRNSSLPGPGAYYNEKNYNIGNNYNSKLINSASVIIGKAKRFLKEDKYKTPGPGTYNIPGLINKTGIINFNSKYTSLPARSFIGKRSDYKIRKIDSTPGPGQYNFFSIFEGYSENVKKY